MTKSKRLYTLILFLFFQVSLLPAQRTQPVIHRLIQQITVGSYKNHFDSLRTSEFCNRKVTLASKQSVDHDACRDYIINTFQKYLGDENVYVDRFDIGKHKGLSNIIAYKSGTDFSKGIWIISAHYDSNNNLEKNAETSPGANDNGTGVAAILEMARIMGEIETEASVLFAAWDFEEVFTNGFPTGSNHWYTKYVKNKQNTNWVEIGSGGVINIQDIKGNLNFDMFGNPQLKKKDKYLLWVCYAKDKHVEFANKYAKTITNYVREIEAVEHGPLIFSDHYTFAARRIPSVENLESDYLNDPFYHSSKDNLQNADNINFEFATNVTKGGLAFLLDCTLPKHLFVNFGYPYQTNVILFETPLFYHFKMNEEYEIVEILNSCGQQVYHDKFLGNSAFAPFTDGLYFIKFRNRTTSFFYPIYLLKKDGIF